MNYEEVVEYIYNIPKFSKKGGLTQTDTMMALLGHPERNFRYVHVAGTNGKGSVCAFIGQSLLCCHQKVGLFTSPHLIKINERIKINGADISDEAFVLLFDCVKQKVDAYIAEGGVHPTFFEFMYMMAMLWFSENKVDFAVVETGLGGRLDATNVIDKPEIVMITSIGRDHMQYLGNTIEAIAAEKAGIIKPGCTLIYDGNKAASASVIEDRALKLGAKAIRVMNEQCINAQLSKDVIRYTYMSDMNRAYPLEIHSGGIYQMINSAAAVQAMEIIGQKHRYFGLQEEAFMALISRGIRTTYWPGRMEHAGGHIYIDGAHNEDGVAALAETIERLFNDAPVYFLFAAAEDKDYTPMIRRICKIQNLAGVMVTAIENNRRADIFKLTEIFKENWHGLIGQTYNIREALEIAGRWTGSRGTLFCTGSLYLAGSIEGILKNWR